MKHILAIIFIGLLIFINSCDNKQQEIYDDIDTTLVVSNKLPVANYKPVVRSSDIVQYNDGTFLYNIDTVFIIGVTHRVDAKIIKRLYDNIPDTIVELFQVSARGKIRKSYIQTSSIMDVNIVSLNHEVFAISKIVNEQPVDENTITEWIWGVTPLKLGSYNLLLKVTIKNNGINKDKIIFDKVVNVQNKPMRNFKIKVGMPAHLKNLSERYIVCTIIETDNADSADFKWGGNGNIILSLQRPSNFTVVKDGDDTINDDKKLFITRWSLIPNTSMRETNIKIKIVGDNSQIMIYNKKLPIDKNFSQKLDNFINNTLQRWYWIFGALIIPIYNYLKVKVSPKKKLFSRKKRVTK